MEAAYSFETFETKPTSTWRRNSKTGKKYSYLIPTNGRWSPNNSTRCGHCVR